MSTNNNFGFELLYKLYEEQITKKEDVILLLVHWYMIKNGFKCIGLGDAKTISTTETQSELLPEGWNQNSTYKLRYVKDNKLYILISTKSDTDLIMNFLKVDDTLSSSLLLSPENGVKDIHGVLENMVPNYKEILHKIKNDLVEPVYTGASINTSTQTASTTRTGPEIPSREPPPFSYEPEPSYRFNRPIPEIGRDDLNPLGRLGGGMIFDPLNDQRRLIPPNGGGSFGGIPERLPPGAIPPNARFDPFGPPRPEPRIRYPPGTELPPGYDDMFM